MANYAQSSEWQPSPPWKESPLDSFQHLRGLLQSPPDSFKEELQHSLPHVQTLVDKVVDHIMEEAQTLSRALGKVYAEYRYDYGNHREYVRIWKCTEVQSYVSKDYSAVSATQEGAYYEWLKMTNIDLHVRRVWKAQHDWQMLTKNKEEQTMLSDMDGPKEPFDVPSVLQEALDSSSSDEKQQSANQIVAMSKEHLMRSIASQREKSRSPRRESMEATRSQPSAPPRASIPPLAELPSTLRHPESPADETM